VPALVVKEHARSPSGVRLLLGAGVSSLIVRTGYKNEP
jgi:hypothetical protein